LEFSVAHRYGSGISANEYLEKFFDFSVQFEVKYDAYDPASMNNYVRSVVDRMIPNKIHDMRYISDHIEAICRNFKLSLREIETFVINVGIYLLAARENEFRPAILVTYLCLLKAKRPDIFLQAKTGKVKFIELKNYFLDHGMNLRGTDDRVIKIFQYYCDPSIDLNSPEFKGWGDGFWRYHLEHDQVIPYLANSIVERFGAPSEIFTR